MNRHDIAQLKCNLLFTWQKKKELLTKYVVGAKANPPKNARRPPKKGKQMAINIVNAERKE